MFLTPCGAPLCFHVAHPNGPLGPLHPIQVCRLPQSRLLGCMNVLPLQVFGPSRVQCFVAVPPVASLAQS